MAEKSTKRNRLNEENVAQIINEWSEKSIEDFAKVFAVTPNTVRSMVYEIRKADTKLCPRKKRNGRADIVKAALKLISAKDELTDK